MSQNLIQATPPNSPPLLQLPHFTGSIIKAVEDAALTETRKHLTLQGFMNFSDSRRRELTKAAGLSSQQYETAIAVAKQLPRLVVERTFFKVTGEKYIIPNSLVQFVVKARFIPPGTQSIPDVDPEDLEDVDPDEFNPKVGRPAEKEVKQHQPPLANAPFFAHDRSPRWHLFLADARQNKIAVPPFTFTTFDKPILDESNKPTFAVQTLKMQFQAPPNVGLYRFQMHLVCDSYIGFDDTREVELELEEPGKADEVDEDDDISEPEEGKIFAPLDPMIQPADKPTDTIAGQMAALRGTTEKPKRQRRPVADEEESDSGSETDEDEDDGSDSDTDTDTDEE